MDALNKGQLASSVHHVSGGNEAIRYLFKRDQFFAATTPDLVLLDLNMPGIDGWQVLKELRSCDSTRHIPVVVMTSFDYDAEFHTKRGLQADGYIVKPVSLATVNKVMQEIKSLPVQSS